MQVSTDFRQESVNGIPLSVLKSALQKYIRRSEVDKGLIVVGYLSAFDDGTPAGKKIRSNITNRFVVCLSEEISVNEASIASTMKQLYLDWCAIRADLALSTQIWVKMLYLLCGSRKCRVVSDVKTAFFLPPIKGSMKEYGELLAIFDQPIPATEDAATAKARFVEALHSKSDSAFTHLRHLLKGSVPRNSDKWIWDAVRFAVRKQAVKAEVSALEFIFRKMTHAEKPIYLYHAILLSINEDQLDLAAASSLPSVPPSILLDVQKRAQAFDGKFDVYVYDKHTSMNRAGSTSIDFAKVGALIPDEDRRFLNPLYRAMYIRYKELLVNGG